MLFIGAGLVFAVLSAWCGFESYQAALYADRSHIVTSHDRQAVGFGIAAILCGIVAGVFFGLSIPVAG